MYSRSTFTAQNKALNEKQLQKGWNPADDKQQMKSWVPTDLTIW